MVCPVPSEIFTTIPIKFSVFYPSADYFLNTVMKGMDEVGVFSILMQHRTYGIGMEIMMLLIMMC